MPIYEYQCASCEAHHEALRKISDEPLTICPACGKPELKKKISAAGFRLSGSGWYETDFKSGNKKNLAGEAGAKSDTPSSSESNAKSTDAKSSSAAKTDKSSGASAG
ncbi:MAG: FmdB family zinc ribbon protein [bacterium]